MNAAAVLFVGIGGAIALAFASRRHARAPRTPSTTCAAWALVEPVPRDVAARAAELLDGDVELGDEFIEPWSGTLYRFVVAMHRPDARHPRPHLGIDVWTCQRVEGARS